MEDRKYVHLTRAIQDGIIYFSSLKHGVAVKTTIDENNNITSSVLSATECEKILMEPVVIITYPGIFHIILVLLIGFFIGAIFNDFNIPFIFFQFIFFVMPYLWSLLEITLPTFKKGSKKYKISKFRSAQYIAVNAYEDLGHIPTLNEAKQYSRIFSRAPETILLNNLLTQLLIFYCFVLSYINKIDLAHYACALFCCIILALIDKKCKFSAAFETLFLRKPTDRELKVAIEGIAQLEVQEYKS